MASTSAGACSQQMDWTEWPVVLASSSAAASSHCGSASTDRCCSRQQSGRSGWPADWLTGPRWARTYRESGPVDKMLTHETTTSDNSTSAHTPRHSLTHPRHAIASASHHIHYSYKGVFIATQLNSTELNWPSWTAYSQVSRVFVYDVTTYKLSQLLFTLSSWVQLSWVVSLWTPLYAT